MKNRPRPMNQQVPLRVAHRQGEVGRMPALARRRPGKGRRGGTYAGIGPKTSRKKPARWDVCRHDLRVGVAALD